MRADIEVRPASLREQVQRAQEAATKGDGPAALRYLKAAGPGRRPRLPAQPAAGAKVGPKG
jgi:hypothetical protein